MQARIQATSGDGRLNERIGRLEVSVESLHGEFVDIRSSLGQIRDVLSRSKETNWSVVFAGVAVAGSLYAAAIRPLSHDIERQERQAVELAKAVSLQNEMQFANKNEMSRRSSEFESLKNEFDYVKEHGSPITDKRLTILEMGVHK